MLLGEKEEGSNPILSSNYFLPPKGIAHCSISHETVMHMAKKKNNYSVI